MKKTHKKERFADEIAEKADRDENVTKYFSGNGKMMPALIREDVQRVNIDFTRQILLELDAEARRLNISRQAVIKTLIDERLDQRALARGKKRAG